MAKATRKKTPDTQRTSYDHPECPACRARIDVPRRVLENDPVEGACGCGAQVKLTYRLVSRWETTIVATREQTREFRKQLERIYSDHTWDVTLEEQEWDDGYELVGRCEGYVVRWDTRPWKADECPWTIDHEWYECEPAHGATLGAAMANLRQNILDEANRAVQGMTIAEEMKDA